MKCQIVIRATNQIKHGHDAVVCLESVVWAGLQDKVTFEKRSKWNKIANGMESLKKDILNGGNRLPWRGNMVII